MWRGLHLHPKEFELMAKHKSVVFRPTWDLFRQQRAAIDCLATTVAPSPDAIPVLLQVQVSTAVDLGVFEGLTERDQVTLPPFSQFAVLETVHQVVPPRPFLMRPIALRLGQGGCGAQCKAQLHCRGLRVLGQNSFLPMSAPVGAQGMHGLWGRAGGRVICHSQSTAVPNVA